MDRKRLKTFMPGTAVNVIHLYRKVNPDDAHSMTQHEDIAVKKLFELATAEPQLSELDQAYLEYGRTVFHSPGGSLGKAAVEPCKRIWELLEVQPNGDKIENKVDGSILNTAEIENIRSWNHNNPTIGGLVASHEALRKKEPELTPLQAKKIELADSYILHQNNNSAIEWRWFQKVFSELQAMIAAETPKPSLAERAREILNLPKLICNDGVIELLREIAKETE